MTDAPQTLREKLKKKRVPVDDVNKFLAYVAGEKHKEGSKDPDKRPVSRNTDDMLYTMFVKFWSLGLVIDGINIVITGKAMAMVTFHGYKNKVKASYPNATFDIQLVRKGDTFNVNKENGRVNYSHKIDNAFSEEEIQGAYCVITIDDNQYFEALNQKDFESMKGGSKMSYLWKTWDSEFWLKSVMKRACKRHFYDIVSEIDKQDNEDYGQTDKPVPTQDIGARVDDCKTVKELQTLMDSLSPEDKVTAQPLVEDKFSEISE